MIRFKTTIGRTFIAIALGVIAYASLFVIAVMLVMEERLHILASGLMLPAVCLLGMPIWIALHFMGFRHWGLAILIAAALSFVTTLGVGTHWFSLPTWTQGYGWGFALRAAALASLIGAAITGAMWRVAYRENEQLR